MAYFQRHIDNVLLGWKNSKDRKPLLIRGARQVGKSSAVRKLGESFHYYAEINLEKQPSLKAFFTEDIDVKKTCENLSTVIGIPIVPNKTLLFIDEIQSCQPAIMSLRYFKEDYPDLHVVAAGSLLEFALEDIPSFAVGRIRSLYMYPFSFDEFLTAQGLKMQVEAKKQASPSNPIVEPLHKMMTEQLRTFLLVGGMPEAVSKWIENHNYAVCSQLHNDIMDTYRNDFGKYKKKVSPDLLKQVIHSVAIQIGDKFVFNQAAEGVRSPQVKDALRLLTLAGLITPVTHTAANGIPLGAEEDDRYAKYLFMDTGLLLSILNIPASDIMLASDTELVNNGAVAEVFAGLEIIKYKDCYKKASMYYWQRHAKNADAEIDYLEADGATVLPIEVKAGTQGAMQSLYYFMRAKHLDHAIRTSLESFGSFDYTDTQDSNSIRHIDIYPLYALSNIGCLGML